MSRVGIIAWEVRPRPTRVGLAAVHGPKEEENVHLWTFRACPQTSVPTGASRGCVSTSRRAWDPGQFLARTAGSAPESAAVPPGTVPLANVSTASNWWGSWERPRDSLGVQLLSDVRKKNELQCQDLCPEDQGEYGNGWTLLNPCFRNSWNNPRQGLSLVTCDITEQLTDLFNMFDCICNVLFAYYSDGFAGKAAQGVIIIQAFDFLMARMWNIQIPHDIRGHMNCQLKTNFNGKKRWKKGSIIS